MKKFVIGLACFVGLTLSGDAWALSCEEIMNMVNVNVPTSIIVQTMEDSGETFSNDDIRCLLNEGAPDEVVKTAKSMSATSRPEETPSGGERDNPEVKKTAAVAIAAACAQNRDNRLEALNANALEPLVEMLEGRDAQTQQSAANALANVIIPRTGNSADTELDANAPHSDHSYEREEIGEGQNKVKELGGVTKLINLVDSGAPRVKEAAAAAIANAMVDNQANRQAFVEAGGVGPLIDLVQSGDPAAQEHATTALWNAMVDNEQSKVDLINHPQGLQVLVQVLLSGTEVTQESAAGAIWKACVADPSIKDRLFVAIPGLVQLLKHGSPGARLQAAGALRTACINNVANKKQLNLVGGIAALVRPCSAPPLAHPPCTRLPLLPAFTLCS